MEQKNSDVMTMNSHSENFGSTPNMVAGSFRRVHALNNIRTSTMPSTLSTPIVSVAPTKSAILHLLDVGLNLDEICCTKVADQVAIVTLKWTKNLGETDLTNIPRNPAVYDMSQSNPLPFDFDDNVLLAVHTIDGTRKHLWFCLANQKLFWLIGSVPDEIQTWRHKMLRREKYVSKVALFIHSSSPNKDTILFAKALRFRSNETTIADVLNKSIRFGGMKRNFRQVLKIQQGLSADAPVFIGLQSDTNTTARMMAPDQRVLSICPHVFRMGEGCFANVSLIPETVSVSQISESFSALDNASLSAPYAGNAKLQHAMMDVDNVVYAMSATELAMKPDMNELTLIQTLRRRLTQREQGDITNFVPSGKWQVPLNTGPTLRPVGGGHWWLLSSPSKTAEPVRFWIHSTDFLEMHSLKHSAFRLAQALFHVFDPTSAEISKLDINNTQHEVKVPGGFLLPLAISIMACRIASAQQKSPDVTIVLETYSNKSHGLKLDALKGKTAFGTNDWLTAMESNFFGLMKYSILNTFQNLVKADDFCCFKLIPEKSSIGFGLSTSYVDEKDHPVYSVCKDNTWMSSDSYESFSVFGLHSEMSTHTTHFKDGPIKRVQAYIEGANAISSKQCGHGSANVYNHIGLSALSKAQTTGILNVTAMLDGIADEFGLVNESIKTMRTCPRNRTEIQVGCIVVEPNQLNFKAMMASAVKVVIESTHHWNIDHIFSFVSLNASAMILIMRQSWTLASEVNRNIVERQQLLDIASATLIRWKSFLTGRGDGVNGPKHDRKLVHLPHLSESLLTNFDSMLPEKARKFTRSDNFRFFGAHEIIGTFNDAFSASMNDRIIKNQKESEKILSQHIMKCVGCEKLFFGASNKDALQLHLVDNSSCIAPDWENCKVVTSTDWFKEYKHVIEDYEKFIDKCSVEQKEACESVLKFGSGLFAIGVAGSGKSVALNEIAKVLNCIFFRDGEILMCAATGLLAENFNPSASTVHSAIGAYPPQGGEQNWNQSVEQWKNWIEDHGKISKNLKVLINTEVYAQSSNMLQALLEIRLDKELKFICLMDGDPPQPMHEDEKDDHLTNRQLCGIQDHILLKHSVIEHLLPEVRVVLFETPLRQLDKRVHDFSNAVRHGQARQSHVQLMRSNPYIPGTTSVDIMLCSLRKDMARHNMTNLNGLPGNVQTIVAKCLGSSSVQDVTSCALRLKVNAPVLFSKALTLNVNKKVENRHVANGTRGIILFIDRDIILVALSGKKLVVEVERVKVFKRGLAYEQFPLELGWATTIKRAGGMTFNTVAIDFGFNWNQSDAELFASARKSWRMSQAYGAITRSRQLAYFVNAVAFKDSVMLAFLNNQNVQALEFLKALVDRITMPYFRSQQEKTHLSRIQNVATEPPTKKKKNVSYELLQMQSIKKSSNDSITSMVYVAKYPNILTKQQAGYYCKGALTSTDSIKVLVKKTYHGHDQQNEIRALEALSGIQGIPTVLGKIILVEETRLVLEDTNAVPCRSAVLTAEQSADLLRIKTEIRKRGWSLHIRDQNIWLNAEKNTVMLFNFEAASCIPESVSVTDAPSSCFDRGSNQNATDFDIDDSQGDGTLFDSSSFVKDNAHTKLSNIQNNFLSGCLENKRTRPPAINQLALFTQQVHGAAQKIQAIGTFGPITRNLTDINFESQTPNVSLVSEAAKKISEIATYSVIIRRERDFEAFTGEKYSNYLKQWDRKSHADQLGLVSELWTRTHNNLFPTLGPGLSWDSGIPYRDNRGYGTASSNLCLLLANVHKKYLTSHYVFPTNLQTFVDIGSGVCNMVLKMSVLKHDFRMCFGIEIVPLRAKFAQSACQLFAFNAFKELLPFCKIIQAETGDACTNIRSQEALKSAGLVWINNELFEEKENMKIFELLNSLVPVGCVIVTFQELLKSKRTNPIVPQSDAPCDFTIHSPEHIADATSWNSKEKVTCVFIIQRTSRFYHNKRHFL
jgi:hypothetical protein